MEDGDSTSLKWETHMEHFVLMTNHADYDQLGENRPDDMIFPDSNAMHQNNFVLTNFAKK